MSAIGKTIARVEERPTDPTYGSRRDDTILIHFTDGTALNISGSSYEEVSLGWSEESSTDLRARERAAGGRREKARVARLQAQAWKALSCDERAERRAARQVKMGPIARAIESMSSQMLQDMRRDANRFSYGLTTDGPQTIKGACPHCGESWCENAPDIPLYSDPNVPPGSIFYQAGTIPVGQQKRKARRS